MTMNMYIIVYVLCHKKKNEKPNTVVILNYIEFKIETCEFHVIEICVCKNVILTNTVYIFVTTFVNIHN